MPDLAPPRRHRLHSWTLASALLLIFGLGPVHGQDRRTYDDFTAQVTAQLSAVDPEAGLLFTRANEARDLGDFAEAEQLYARVRERRPGFDHAIRRLCHVIAAQGRTREAVSYCRESLALSDSIENKATLLAAMTGLYGGPPLEEAPPSGVPDGGERPTPAVDGPSLALEIISSHDLDPGMVPMACLASIQLDRLDLLRLCARRAVIEQPSDPASHYFAWVAAMTLGDIEAAEAALERARALGLPEEMLDHMESATAEARPLTDRLLRPGLWLAGAWLGGLILLLLVGSALSRLALQAARQAPTDRTGASSGMAAGLRKTYQAVLMLSSIYYYLSIPLVLALVLLIGGGLLYGLMSLGRIPVKLVLIVVVVVAVTIWATLKGFLVRGQDEDPGERLDLDRHPRLRRLLDEVAGQIDTRPVDSVYMTPGTDLAVMERGGMLRKMRGSSERCLILGVGVLDGMTLGPFRAILGHEYGHFSNKDTAGGTFALAVRRSIAVMAQTLARGGAATWYSPAWIFLNAFHRIFLRISQGASRLQEIMADRWAAFAYGARPFEDGLRHVIERSIRFSATSRLVLDEVIDQKKSLVDLYSYVPARQPDQAELAAAVEKAIHAEPSAYDSHPAPATRFQLVHALGQSPAHAMPDANEPVWSLFSDRQALQRQMTELVRSNLLLHHGLAIPGAETTGPEVAAT